MELESSSHTGIGILDLASLLLLKTQICRWDSGVSEKEKQELRTRNDRHRTRERTLKPKDLLQGEKNRIVKGVGSGIRPPGCESWHSQLANTLCLIPIYKLGDNNENDNNNITNLRGRVVGLSDCMSNM